jgi:hypothetical protein
MKLADLLPRLAIIGYCTFLSQDAYRAVMSSSGKNGFGWLALSIWLIPLIYATVWRRNDPRPGLILPICAVVLATLGTLSSINALQHYGLIISLASLMPATWTLPLWILCGPAWTPSYGWLASRLFFGYVVPTRIFLASIPLVVLAINRISNRTTAI